MQATLETLRQACQTLYSELSVLTRNLLSLAPPVPMITRTHISSLSTCYDHQAWPWHYVCSTCVTHSNTAVCAGQKHGMPSIYASPSSCGTLASILYIGLVSSLAVCAHDSHKALQRQSKQDNHVSGVVNFRYVSCCAAECPVHGRMCSRGESVTKEKTCSNWPISPPEPLKVMQWTLAACGIARLGFVCALSAACFDHEAPFPHGLHCRMPQLVMAASACAFMLRLSLVNMQGASGLASDTYKFVAVSLTLATVCTSLAQSLQVSTVA